VVEYRPAVPDDAVRLIADIRPADRLELEATAARPLVDTVLESLALSDEPLAAESDGRLLCLLGIAPFQLLSDIGVPWLIGTNALRAKRKTLLAEGRRFVSFVSPQYPRLANMVDARNTESVGWLRRLGFAIDPPVPFGPYGLPFHRFHRGFASV